MELSFGEQIKIILKRKNMTIQQLASLYEEHTGCKMSRQNMTQRLKRDNFPEQDMHIIAALLGFQVSVRLTPLTVNVPGLAQETPAVPVVPVYAMPAQMQNAPVPPVPGQMQTAPVPPVPVQIQVVPAAAMHITATPESAAPPALDDRITFDIPDAFRKNRPQGDINPLTGEEYLTNTVRRHPKIEEYVQVYDQATHEWSDVREDYFWEFQEKKKQMMGADYRAPIMI